MADNKSTIQVVIAIIGLVGVLGAAVISQWDKIFPKPDKNVIGSAVDSTSKISDPGNNDSSVTSTGSENIPVIQKFEDKLVALVGDSHDCFTQNKEKELGYINYKGLADCIAYIPKIKLSDINSDTIFYFKNKLCQYVSQTIEGDDSVSIFNKFKEYKLKISYALPDFEEIKEPYNVTAYFEKDKTSISMFFFKKIKYRVLIMITQK